jgi:hypothetical protein
MQERGGVLNMVYAAGYRIGLTALRPVVAKRELGLGARLNLAVQGRRHGQHVGPGLAFGLGLTQ